jgi:ribosomal protein L22
MAKAMQQLQQQMARLGKDLAEQLKNGQAQAAQATLQKMIEQLQSASLTQEQLQKIMEEVSAAAEPGSEYGKVGDYLKSAAGQIQKGQKPGAAQNLAAAAKELDKLLQQMADAESLQAALDALDQAQLAIASGKGWSECKRFCRFCNGAGCSHCRGWRHGGGRGAGVGTWADEGMSYLPEDGEAFDNSGIVRPDMDSRGHADRPDDLNPDLAPTKVRGQISPGGSMPSITLKGVSIKGTSSVKYQEAAAAAQAEAQAALNQDLVPRAYQGAVRDYFDDLKR